MTGKNEHQNPVLDKAAELKQAYDEAYSEYATHLGILKVKQDILAVLQAGVETNQIERATGPDQRASFLVAHHINVMAAPLQRDLVTAGHDATESLRAVELRLTESRQHFIENAGAYITHAAAIAPAEPGSLESFVA